MHMCACATLQCWCASGSSRAESTRPTVHHDVLCTTLSTRQLLHLHSLCKVLAALHHDLVLQLHHQVTCCLQDRTGSTPWVQRSTTAAIPSQLLSYTFARWLG